MIFRSIPVTLYFIIISSLLQGCACGPCRLIGVANDLDEQTHRAYQKGDYARAVQSSQKSVRIKKAILGQRNLGTIIGQNNLAELKKQLGRPAEALALLKQNYALSQKYFGNAHQNTAQTLNDLAMIYQNQGRLEEALALSQQSHESIKKILGTEHPETLQSLQTISSIYQDFSQFSEAMYYSQKNLEIRERVLGKENVNTLDGQENLARLYMSLGNFSAALDIAEQVYFARDNKLGRAHPKTIHSFANLAKIYSALGRQKEVLAWVKDVHQRLLHVLGKQHPDTLKGLGYLADIYHDLGYTAEALPLAKEAYQSLNATLGPAHPDTLQAQQTLALLYKDAGKDSLPLFESVYSQLQSRAKNAQTLKARHHLAEALYLSGDTERAIILFEQNYQYTKEVLGAEHPDSILGLQGLASAYADTNQIDKAISHFETFVSAVESLRNANLSLENQRALFQQWISGYFMLLKLYIQQGAFEKAFVLSEMTKARTLLQSIAATLAAEQGGLAGEEQNRLTTMEESLAILNNRIAAARQDARTDEVVALEHQRNQLSRSFNALHHELMAKYPKYSQLSTVRIIKPEEGKELLSEDAVFVSYFIKDAHVFAFTLESNGKLSAHNLGPIPDFNKQLDAYRRSLAPVPVRDIRGTIIRFSAPKDNTDVNLGKYLLEPLKNVLKDKSHWIISPSGPLALIIVHDKNYFIKSVR